MQTICFFLSWKALFCAKEHVFTAWQRRPMQWWCWTNAGNAASEKYGIQTETNPSELYSILVQSEGSPLEKVAAAT